MPTLAQDNPLPVTLLQAQGGSGGLPVQVLMWVGVLIVVAIVGGAVVMVLRRRMFDPSNDSSGAGSLLEDLRRMKREGEISDAEFEQAKRALTEKIARTLDAKRAHADAIRPRTGGATSKPARKPPPARPGPGKDAPPGYDLTGEPLPRPHDPE